MEILTKFIYSEDSSISKKIKTLPAEQLKELKEEDIMTVIKAYYDISGDTQGKEIFWANAQLEILVGFLHSPFLDT